MTGSRKNMIKANLLAMKPNPNLRIGRTFMFPTSDYDFPFRVRKPVIPCGVVADVFLQKFLHKREFFLPQVELLQDELAVRPCVGRWLSHGRLQVEGDEVLLALCRVGWDRSRSGTKICGPESKQW